MSGPTAIAGSSYKHRLCFSVSLNASQQHPPPIKKATRCADVDQEEDACETRARKTQHTGEGGSRDLSRWRPRRGLEDSAEFSLNRSVSQHGISVHVAVGFFTSTSVF